jgi:hypothetical protein
MAGVYELKKVIYDFLSSINTNVYDEITPQNITYPYIVYILNDSDTNENQKMEEFDLRIDVFANNQFDSTDMDSIVGQIDGDGAIVGATGLHRKHYYSAGEVRADFYRTNRNSVQDNEKNIKHVELTYDVFVYFLS